MLASNFDGFIPFLVGVLLALVAAGLVSLIPAASGHWLSLVLALPCAVIGLLLIWNYPAESMSGQVFLSALYFMPFPIGFASIMLWWRRRKQRE